MRTRARVACVVVSALFGCTAERVSDEQLVRDLPTADQLNSFLPAGLPGAGFVPADDAFRDGWIEGRSSGPVGVSVFWNDNPRNPGPQAASVAIILYDTPDRESAMKLYRNEPPEIAYADRFPNFKDRSPEWVKQRIDSWRFKVPGGSDEQSREGMCLAGPLDDGLCYGFDAWVFLCNNVVEINYATAVGIGFPSHDVETFLARIIDEVAARRGC